MGKYEPALEAGQQELAIRQKLDEQLNFAKAYYRLGHIHKAWNKYKEAIANHKQSLDRYQQLNKIADVSNLGSPKNLSEKFENSLPSVSFRL